MRKSNGLAAFARRCRKMPGIGERRAPISPAIRRRRVPSIAAVSDQVPVLVNDSTGLTSSGLLECGHKSGEKSLAVLIGTLAKCHGCRWAEPCQSLRAQASSSWHSMSARRPIHSVSRDRGRSAQAETLC